MPKLPDIVQEISNLDKKTLLIITGILFFYFIVCLQDMLLVLLRKMRAQLF